MNIKNKFTICVVSLTAMTYSVGWYNKNVGHYEPNAVLSTYGDISPENTSGAILNRGQYIQGTIENRLEKSVISISLFKKIE
ncbi:MAG: hypothetical protein A2639_00550 [Candidatus Staskawiczbacteria bacterium RIFCSPHIGHO2_01_FULL_34_27]|uniref:Uncharacterized protein n=1 Tax=Candidatus Staskawiczbacteria bacterium RIFCSPHIGHO2_01_FULL_34_27 TaxID=1802199 RepID=A0A1G2HJA4_9BACT|nr:hypothetical protein [Candidatus Pacearchaeota archaeon]OGZ62557.1 MAG: hypothetical protein A2639_00550 [Candidatus Staskawiczbacteria bacterium RIFCSPHIGHO2_01_FULL_34_27]